MHIPLTAKNLIRYPEQQAGAPETPHVLLSVPTGIEKDQLSARLVALGLSPVTDTKIRATLIDELWELHKDEQADEIANFLDGYWQREQIHERAMASWGEQEIERIADQEAGAPKRDPYPMPIAMVTIRESSRATLIFEDMMARSQRLRDLAADRLNYEQRANWFMVRLHVKDFVGMDVPPDMPMIENGALTETATNWLREELGRDRWLDLQGRIDAMYNLTGQEEKNSVSPLGSLSDPSGLPARNDDLAPSDGSLMTSNILPLPIAESAPITVPLSTPISESEVSTATTFPTDAA